MSIPSADLQATAKQKQLPKKDTLNRSMQSLKTAAGVILVRLRSEA